MSERNDDRAPGAPRELTVNVRSFDFEAGGAALAVEDPFGADGAGELLRVVPTTEAQREIWLADRLGDRASLAYNESASLHFEGPLDTVALSAAVRAIGERHEALRSTVGADGTELWVHAGQPLEPRQIDVSGLPATERARALAAERTRAVETRFDLATGPLVRAVLMRSSPTTHELMLTAHHIVCDGWSLGVLADELLSLYRAFASGQPSFLDPAPRFSDYALAQRSPEALASQAADERWWLDVFKASIPTLDLPTDRPRAAGHRRFDSLREDHVVDRALAEAVKRFGAQNGASLFATLFAAFGALLARVAGSDDVVIGVPAAGQPAAGEPGLVGHCVNVLPIRLAIDPARTAAAHLQATRGAVLDATDHASVTFGSLLKAMPIERDPARLTMVSVLFNLDAAIAPEKLSDERLRVRVAGNPRHAENFELFVNVVQEDGGLRIECQYNTALFDAATVRRWLLAYETLLRAQVADGNRPLGQLGWLAPSEQAALRALQPPPVALEAGERMQTAFLRQAARTPERTALRHGDEALAYRALDERSNRLARALRSRGIGRGDRVGLCLERGVEMVVAMLAVMKSGAAYVPLDPGFPPARLAYYAEDAQLALLVTEAAVAAAPSAWRDDAADRILVLDRDDGWSRESSQPLPPAAQDALGDDAAYVIYTSGSTGKPKGVCVPHRAVANFLASMAVTPGIAADDRLAAVTTLSFDIAVLELLLPLSVGAEVIIVPREVAMDGARLAGLLRERGATLMQATPGLWRVLLDTAWRPAPGFKALVGGEACPPDLARSLLERCGQLWNMYGPTETTVWSTTWRVDLPRLAQAGMSIGTPIANTQVWILDERLEPCPIGVPGEICIGGTGVALGYLDRPELTADRFVPDRMGGDDGARVYRTGDRGRWRNDGLLEHLGRLDFQVKVRGYRIELGEIESACADFADVAQSVAMAREDRPGDVRLVAYVTQAPGTTLDVGALRSSLRARLPDYMLPQHIVVLPALPTLPNGKIDRKQLPAPQAAGAKAATAPAGASGAERVPARNEHEAAALAAIEEALGLPGLGIRDNFFALGGHSLLAARLVTRLNRAHHVQLTLRTVFDSPTAEKLGAAIERLRAAGAPDRAPIPHDPSRVRGPLTPMQDRMRFVEELHPGRLQYNTPSAHRLTGALDRAKFEQALRLLVERQPSLRMAIAPKSGGGHEQVVMPATALALPFEDLRSIPAERREAELMARMQSVVDTPFDIARAPLFRAGLYRLADDQHAFLFMAHHIVWDGWSFDLLYEELAALYGALVEGRAPTLAPPAITYLDYASWLAEWMQGAECRRQIEFWKARFAQAPATRQPRTDLPRDAQSAGKGATEVVRFDSATTERLRDVARRHELTLSMLAMSVYALMMASAIAAESVVVGLPVRGRQRPETEDVMGLFINLLPLQFAVRPDTTLGAFLDAVRADTVEVLENQEVPFERIAEEPAISAHATRFGLYHALFSFQDARERTRVWGGLKQENILLFQKGSTEDLVGLWLMDVPAGLEGGFTYNADIYLPETAQAMRTRYGELMERVSANPTVTLAELVDPAGSAAARWLRRLAGDDPTAATADANANANASVSADPTVVPVAKPKSAPGLATENERQLAQIWAGLLDIDVGQIAAQDNFFDLGGHSLLAMRAIESAGRTLGFRVDARRYYFENLGQLANAEAASTIASARSAPRRDEEPTGGGLLRKVFGAFGAKRKP